MSKTINPFKQRLLDGQKLIGGWTLSGSPTVAEAMAFLNYDYLVVDLEHSPASIHDTTPILRAVEQTPTAAVVRMPSHDPIAIKQVLDQGGMTLYFPFVESVEEAKAIVQASMYPPLGKRGFAKMHRAARYTTREDYPAAANEQVCLIPQLETVEALELAVEIGQLDGVSAVFIGPGDLSMTMGLPGQVNHPDVRAKIVACVTACNQAGIPVGTVMPTPDDAKWALEVGFSFVSIANDLANMLGQCKAHLAQMKNS
ncbi:2-dehydro-3-deoxyglucarate aldolase [Marinomonas rhizomae]|jgi:2-dehydro-3-deoxyglucarate aldolase|uniref:2-dehydro-3-deoxyglucarate aldolase/4-hydroxy-2-oxoheptanedioate aldolase n=1 Tax=Marinomonas rhizomae TaxID=491948 RepID=A0A366J2N3_9GAMM|nr:aldolase/citrate lyase family protein [Marinomonas rhizomae]RBP81202.1 2-dehydro-3-deoxyglucarate aldolase/4-hydroxy-2-oxoheptanedioate aldolase [Marinomonas rhizomae]RNF72354.1 2-dehydro-3-deoxyglucarate aldolase [Marinomonas rhizomae]UTW00011.1 2-dehydro-3-deoxyglucarate aldolase [Marinomonas rhizomae]